MAEELLTGIKDTISLFELKLNEKVAELDQQDRVAVIRITTLPTPDNIVLSNPRGYYGIIFNGDDYVKDERVKSTTLVMKRNLMLGVISAIRFYDNPNAPVDNYPMIPGEYTELAMDVLSGVEVFNKRPSDERLIYPVRTELIFEHQGIWVYLTSMIIPLDFNKI
jgi:hypothetical protein